MANNGDNRDWQRDRGDREFDDREHGNRWGDGGSQADRYATGQSGYSAGRSGQDRAMNYQNRNQGYSPGSFEDRQSFGSDDRFTGRGGRGDYSAGYGDRNDDRDFGRDIGRDRDWRDRTSAGQGGMYGYRDVSGYGGSSMQGDYGPSESERGVWQTDVRARDDRGYGAQGPGQGRSGGYARDRRDIREDREDYRQNRGYQGYGGEATYNTGGFNNQTGWGVQGGQPMREGPHRGKGPRGYQRSDERIKETVCEALTDDPHIDASGIDVEVRNGEVILSGMVPDRQTKRSAEDCVERLSGVRDVTNQLKVSSDERDKLGRAHQEGNQTGNGIVSSHENDSRKDGKDDKKARA